MAEARALRGSRLRTLGLFLNNVSLALGAGLLAYYVIRYGGWDSFLPELSDQQVRYYALTTVAVALALNLISYIPMSYGKALETGRPKGEFDYESWRRDREDAEALLPKPNPAVREDRRPAPQVYPSFMESPAEEQEVRAVEEEVEEVNEVDESDALEDALHVWEDEAPTAMAMEVPPAHPESVEPVATSDEDLVEADEPAPVEEAPVEEASAEEPVVEEAPVEDEAAVDNTGADNAPELEAAEARLAALRARLSALGEK